MPPELKEAGRVYNKTNEGLLRGAYQQLKNALKALGTDPDATESEEDEATGSSDDKKETKAATAKATTKAAKEAATFSQSDTAALLQAALTKSAGNSYYPYIQDIYEDQGYFVYRRDYNGGYYRCDFSIDESGAVTLGTPVEVVRKVTYISPVAAALGEAGSFVHGPVELREGVAVFGLDDVTSLVPLVEKAVANDGKVRIKLISPGKGSSGYYPPEVLKRDGPRVFKAGTKMFWNHQTMVEEAERPEGNLDDFAAVLTEDANWADDPKHGPGLYAWTKVFEGYREKINEIGPYIGTSIRASGRAKMGSVEGVGRVPIVEALVSAKSVDFVTTPGAGGKVLELFESARRARSGTSADSAEHTTGVEEMDRTEVQALIESAVGPLKNENAQLREALQLSRAERIVTDELNRDQYRAVPSATRARLATQLVSAYPLTEAGTIDVAAYQTKIAEAVKGELRYLTEAAGVQLGAIEGFGNVGAGDGGTGANGETILTEANSELSTMFAGWGLSEAEAKIAAAGRVA